MDCISGLVAGAGKVTMAYQVAIYLDMVVTTGSSYVLARGEISLLIGKSSPAVAQHLLGSDQRA